MILPHRVTHRRRKITFTAAGHEKAAAPDEPETEVKALIVPARTDARYTPFGDVETQDDLILIEALDDAGELRVIRKDDLLIDERTEEVWIAMEPGKVIQDPSRFTLGPQRYHHVEVKVRRSDPEAEGLFAWPTATS